MKKLYFIPIGILVLGLIGGGIYFFGVRNRAQIISPGGEKIAATPSPAVDLTTWNDEAGFSIQFPKDLSVNKHEEDPDNYAHLELTHKDHPGKVIVWVKDLPLGVTTLESWIKKLHPDGTSLDTTLGGEPGKKILSAAPVKMLTVGTISDNLLFYIEGTLTDSEYWQGVHDTISQSFTFTDGSTAGSGESISGSAPVSDIDEEEVLQ